METAPKTPRGTELLLSAADDLVAGNMLLNGAFLDKHNVTADEALGIADLVAALIRGYLRLDPELQAMMMLLAIDTEHEIPTWLAFRNAYTQRAARRMRTGEDKEEAYFPKKEK